MMFRDVLKLIKVMDEVKFDLLLCCSLLYRGSTDDLLWMQISSDLVWQFCQATRCFFTVLNRDLFVFNEDSLKR